MKVGVFDSGVGGLSVVKSLLEHQLFEEIIYYGDTARVPYGIRDKNTIIRYSLDALEFFKNFDIDLLIVACNTVSAYALDEMREAASFEIVGVVEAGALACKNALNNPEAKVLILGTKATVNSKAYETLLTQYKYKNLSALATSLFVPIVEEELYEGEVLESTMNHYFKTCDTPDAIILGCTHFPLIANSLESYFDKKPILIHSGEAIVEYLENRYELLRREEETKLKIFASDNVAGLRKIAEMWL